MSCASCGRANRPGARFCGGCGRPLTLRCPACSAESDPDAQFCDACGAPLAGPTVREAGARKVVTIVFADLIGSTSLHERLDAESARRLMDRYYRTLDSAVEAHGGRIVKLLGDGVMAAFGVPRVAEDDAIRAVRAAVGMQRAFRELASEPNGLASDIGLRVAVNTGEVVVSDDQTDVVGDPVNVAARLQQEAGDGEVLIGEATRRLVGELVTLAPFGELALKGRSETVAAYRVVSLDRPPGAAAIAFVGREDELRRLLAVYETAASRGARIAVVLGSPGLGKSRLIDELGHRLGERASVLIARCDSAGGTTFAPLAEALRAFLQLDAASGGSDARAAIAGVIPGDEAERTRVVEGIAALLSGAPAEPEETFFVVRRFLAAIAASRPVVLAIDDLQWAEPLLLDLVEHLAQWSGDVPLCLLAAGRPELRDSRSSLAAPGGRVTDVVTLGGLDAGAATRLAANVVGADELPAALAGRVLATSEGNPLFVGELVRMLVHDGALRREGDRWIAAVELAGLEMPPTIHALLAARIERLRPEDRAVVERAAVVGRQFSRAAVAHLLSPEIGDLDARLESLRRSELVEPDAGWFLGEPALRFHHVLVRDAAYRRLLKGTRAELHARFADWLETRVGEAAEHDETIGWHLEQAHQHLRELGAIDAHGRAVGERAASRLAAAGRRALARDDLRLAASLLGRALARLDDADPARAELMLDWCEALLSAGDVGPAARAIEQLDQFTAGSPRLRAWRTCLAGQLAVLSDPQALRATAGGVAQAAAELAAAGDTAGEAKAHSVHALALARLGEIGAGEAALDRALAAARRGNERRRANAVLAGAPLAALWGPSPVTRASGRCLDVVRVLRITQGSPAVEAVALRCQAVLEALRGRTGAARRMIESSRRMVEELGIQQRLLEADVFAGLIELLEGDAAGAERRLRAAYEGLREHGLGIDAAQAAALLGRALLAQGRAAEAEGLSHESEALAGDDLKAAIAWRGVRAEALARRGEHAAAVDLARAAVRMAEATDALLDHADARLALAAALRAVGRGDEARVEEARAIELWEEKGATLLAERARSGGPRREAAELPSRRRSEPLRFASRRVRANAAIAEAERTRAAVVARDPDALPPLFAELTEIVEHPTGATFDGTGMLTAWRSLLRARDPALEQQALATLGDSLALYRSSMSFAALAENDVAPFGAVRRDELVLIEAGETGHHRRIEFFALDHLNDAVVRLYQRYAELLPEGAERARAAATARSIATLLGTDIRSYASALARDVAFVDHRSIPLPSGHGAKKLLRGFGALFEMAESVAIHVEEILAAEPGTLLGRWTVAGTEGRGSGAFEAQFLRLVTFAEDGLVSRLEVFPTTSETEAFARFDELTAAPPPPRWIANAATRSLDRFEDACRVRDWEGIAALLGAGFRNLDRRKMIRLELDRDQFLESMRLVLEVSPAPIATQVLATRGDRSVLVRARFAGNDREIGPSEAEWLMALEVDAAGNRLTMITFDPEDLDAAVDELTERYAAGEGASYPRVQAVMRSFGEAFTRRDWESLETIFAPDLVVSDHRLLGWEPLRGPQAYVEAMRSMTDLAPDARIRPDHVTMSHHAYLAITTWVGTREGGAFEAPSFVVAEVDGTGRICRVDSYDLHRRDEAEARFEEIAANRDRDSPHASVAPGVPARPVEQRRDALRIPPNAATDAMDRWQRFSEARDWHALAALFAPDLVCEDRRRLFRHSWDRDWLIAGIRLVVSSGGRVSRTTLATAGDRLELEHLRFSEKEALFEVEALQLVEVDAADRVVAVVTFDPDDRRAAALEMFARYFGSDAARWTPPAMVDFVSALNDHDLGRMRGALPDDFVFHDHRRTGVGRIGNADDYIASIAAMLQQSPDLTTDVLYHVAAERHGSLSVGRMFGTLAGGGEFESVYVRLNVYEENRCRGTELFEIEDLALARARFEELRSAR